MLEIINYMNLENEEITIRYDEKLDRTIYWNLDKQEVKEIVDIAHYEAKQQILDIISDEFKELIFIDEILYYSQDIDYIEGKCKNEFIKAYNEYFKHMEE